MGVSTRNVATQKMPDPVDHPVLPGVCWFLVSNGSLDRLSYTLHHLQACKLNMSAFNVLLRRNYVIYCNLHGKLPQSKFRDILGASTDEC